MSGAYAGTDFTIDAFHRCSFRLAQPRGGHRAGLDALLLAATLDAGKTGAEREERCLDMGAGTGAVGVAVAAHRLEARVTLAERDPTALAALRETVRLNPALAPRIVVLPVDLAAPGAKREAAGLVPGGYDRALANPPFNGLGHRSSPDARRADAHVMDPDLLDAWCRAAAGALRSGGTLTMILRPASLSDLLAAWTPRFGGPSLRPVHTRPGAATRLLAHGAHGARTPPAMLASLHVDETFARALADGTARVPMG